MADQTPEQIAAAAAAEVATKAADTRLQEMVQGAVKTSIEGFVKEAQAKRAEAEAAHAAEEAAKRTPGGMEEMFRPHLEPALKAARDAETRATLAADAAEFYADPKNTVAIEFRPKITEVVQAQAKRGNPITHKDAWNWLRGGELYETLGKRQEETLTAKIEEARKAQTAGPGVGPATRITKPLDDMQTDELGEALKGVRF